MTSPKLLWTKRFAFYFVPLAMLFAFVTWLVRPPANFVELLNESGESLHRVAIELLVDPQQIWELSIADFDRDQLLVAPVHAPFARMRLRVRVSQVEVANIEIQPPGRYGRTMVVVAEDAGQWSIHWERIRENPE